MINKILKSRLKYFFSFFGILSFIVIPLIGRAEILENPLGEGVDITALMIRIIEFILRGLGIFGVFMVIYGGFLFLIAGGNEETIKKAKATLVWAVIGLAIILCSRIIVGFVATTLNPGITTQSTSESDAADKESQRKAHCALSGGTCTPIDQQGGKRCVSDDGCSPGSDCCYDI